MSTTDPFEMDREEHVRVLALRRAKRSQPCFREGKWTKRAPRHPRTTISLNGRILGIANAATAGDMIQRMLVRHAEFEAMQGVPVAHVKNRKPLTAHGAKLLGVPWTGNAEA